MRTLTTTRQKRASLCAAALVCAFANSASARDLAPADISEIRQAALARAGGESRLFGIRAWWGQVFPDRWQLTAWVTRRPMEVVPGLCVLESFELQRREGDPSFLFREIDREYWRQSDEEMCDRVTRDSLPHTVWAPLGIPTAVVERIMDGAHELLRATIPEVRCNEQIMDRLFQPGVLLRLKSVSFTDQYLPGVGITYHAYFEWEDRNAGPEMAFSFSDEGFQVHRSCFMNVSPMHIDYID
jgi:hypothetical protein